MREDDLVWTDRTREAPPPPRLTVCHVMLELLDRQNAPSPWWIRIPPGVVRDFLVEAAYEGDVQGVFDLNSTSTLVVAARCE